ncbi:dihydroxyacetone kinase, phosphoprotein-dependent, L subunit [Bellilinea caldifistulae]|uniref:dihydroxyacetone kinase subunit DhaL n=1 Tax=Bellilinea caldifistulae TaxID=360411 RepID=UPI000782F0A2|nr:dihydroxyacetone kinase subunit DhaL [Bellilinea caldifistulae]GAP09671.1 dihydroxyacetone kinase, phosphoprotein-dependent, L subunit [Bellilinea caldifistulae]
MYSLYELRLWFKLLAAKFQQQQDYLNQLDQAIGDGDHGFTLARAFASANYEIEKSVPTDLGIFLDVVASAVAENGGGAIGPLLAAFFAEGGTLFRNRTFWDIVDLQNFFERGANAISELGGAKAGQKTLLDALLPAVRALKESQFDKEPVMVVKNALEAAYRGSEATRQMVATFGRAAFLGERSIGHPDPGAMSFVLIMQCLFDALNGKQDEILITDDTTEEDFIPPGKFINRPEHMIAEDNQGLAMAYPGIVEYLEEGILVRKKPKAEGKVGLTIGHGGGHTPSMGGLVGVGLLDTDVYGPLFTCASGIKIARAIQLADRHAGVVLLVSNHSGDVLNARMALRRAAEWGIDVKPVYLGDDVATAPRSEIHKRRGLGGLLFALKIGGAAAEMGQPINEVVRLMEKANLHTATLAIATRPPTHPVSGKPLFELQKGQMEIGTGVHGEVGVYRGPILPAEQVVEVVINRLLDDLAGLLQRKVLVFLNGAGGTSHMELNILYRNTYLFLKDKGVQIAGAVVESLFTTLEMGGVSFSLLAIDDEMEYWWQKPALSAHFRWPTDVIC